MAPTAPRGKVYLPNPNRSSAKAVRRGYMHKILFLERQKKYKREKNDAP
jgi:hypothetical protein